MIAVDFGSWTDTPSPEQIECWRNQGVTKAIIGTKGNARFNAQVQACVNGGLSVEAYVYLYFTQSGKAQAEAAVAKCSGFPISRLWLDVELAEDEANPGYQVVNQVLAEAFTSIPQTYDVGIYTSRHYWDDVFGMPSSWNDLPLWNAYYDNDPDIDFLKAPYGGWEDCAIEQYAGSVTLCGLNVDLNALKEEARMYDDKTIDQKLVTVITELANTRDNLKAAIAQLAVANAGSFKAIEDRLKALEAK